MKFKELDIVKLIFNFPDEKNKGYYVKFDGIKNSITFSGISQSRPPIIDIKVKGLVVRKFKFTGK